MLLKRTEVLMFNWVLNSSVRHVFFLTWLYCDGKVNVVSKLHDSERQLLVIMLPICLAWFTCYLDCTRVHRHQKRFSLKLQSKFSKIVYQFLNLNYQFENKTFSP